MLRMATGDGERVDHTVVYRALENVILGALLTKQAHNYSGLLDRSVPPADLRVVRLAEEFIEARCGDPISSPDIAQAAGVSLRTLQRTFRRYRNCTPTQFLRDCRLDRSRLMLLASGGRSLVSDVAIECGFGHMGQFSLAYRKRFGESPSQTLARSKA
jgi:transcriptional regulator GlxA family with amidase domain